MAPLAHLFVYGPSLSHYHVIYYDDFGGGVMVHLVNNTPYHMDVFIEPTNVVKFC
jgi:hypothetical protein